jgi:uncharacterized protein (TIGR00369 family)
MNPREMTGLQFLKGIQSGEIPPPGMGLTLGMERPEVERGSVRFRIRPDERHTNPLGQVHGGFYAGHLDSATGIPVHSMLGPGEGFATVELSIKMLRSAPVGAEDLHAEGKLVHMTRNFAFSEGRIVDSAGTIYALATATCAILRPRPAEA